MSTLLSRLLSLARGKETRTVSSLLLRFFGNILSNLSVYKLTHAEIIFLLIWGSSCI